MEVEGERDGRGSTMEVKGMRDGGSERGSVVAQTVLEPSLFSVSDRCVVPRDGDTRE